MPLSGVFVKTPKENMAGVKVSFVGLESPAAPVVLTREVQVPKPLALTLPRKHEVVRTGLRADSCWEESGFLKSRCLD